MSTVSPFVYLALGSAAVLLVGLVVWVYSRQPQSVAPDTMFARLAARDVHVPETKPALDVWSPVPYEPTAIKPKVDQPHDFKNTAFEEAMKRNLMEDPEFAPAPVVEPSVKNIPLDYNLDDLPETAGIEMNEFSHSSLGNPFGDLFPPKEAPKPEFLEPDLDILAGIQKK